MVAADSTATISQMAVQRWPICALLFLTTFASTGSGSSPAVADEPADEWVKTGPDSVMDAETFEELDALADEQVEEYSTGDGFFASVTFGDGFDTFEGALRHYGDYNIKLITNNNSSPNNVDINTFRDEVVVVANQINTHNGISFQVLAGTYPPPANWLNFSIPVGEIWLTIESDATNSPCGNLTGGFLGCGGVRGSTTIEGVSRWTGGIVWLNPQLSAGCDQPVIGHEIGHALGLDHYDSNYPAGVAGGPQLMKSSTTCNTLTSPDTFQSGDLNGIRWGAEPTPSNDSKSATTAAAVCPGDSIVTASTWFATSESGELAHAGHGPRRSVWFRYDPRPEQDGLPATVTTGNEFNSVMALYSGASSPSILLDDDDDSGPGTGSQISFTVNSSLTYWIAIDGNGFARGATVVDFDLPPIIDDLVPLCAPARLLDTRSVSGDTIDELHEGGGNIAANTTYQLPVAGRADIPLDADSVVLNVTAYQPSAYGYLTVFPCGVTPPTASNLNFFAGDVIPNAVVARIGSANSVCFRSSVSTGLIVDAGAYFPASDALVPLDTPARLLETRVGPSFNTIDDLHEGVVGGILANDPYELDIYGRDVGSSDDVLDGEQTVVLNVTAIHPDAAGFLTVYSCDAAVPTASNLNFVAGDVISNLVIARVSAVGQVCFKSSQTTDLVVDVTGYFAATAPLVPLDAPERMLDTRSPSQSGSTIDLDHLGVGEVAAGTTYELPIAGRGSVSADAVSVVLNVTALRPNANGFITVFACGQDRPTASNLNFKAGEVIPNFVLARLGTGGKVCIYTSQQSGIIVDVSGYFL